ncbi:hypothetical protein RJ640_000850, partial [Escallonia rubra]
VSDMDVPAAAMEFQDHSGKISPQRKLGRGNNEIKRIENMKNCQVTFCKRQNGLLKKAYEFFVLGTYRGLYKEFGKFFFRMGEYGVPLNKDSFNY